MSKMVKLVRDKNVVLLLSTRSRKRFTSFKSDRPMSTTTTSLYGVAVEVLSGENVKEGRSSLITAACSVISSTRSDVVLTVSEKYKVSLSEVMLRSKLSSSGGVVSSV